MSSSTTTDSHKILACVTGASGFIGAAVALRFLDLGHSVRLPLRGQAQLDAWTSKYGSQYGKRLEVVLLGGGIEQDGVFDDIARGCEVVVHVASPAVFDIKVDAETDTLKPALRGTLSILESAKKAGTVKSFVYTSSLAAYLTREQMANADKNTVIDAQRWNETTYEEAAEMSTANGPEVYASSKALAEKSAWDFVKQPDVHFSLSTSASPPSTLTFSADFSSYSIAPAFTLGRHPAPTIKTLADMRGHSSLGIMLEQLWDKKEFSPLESPYDPKLFVGIDSVAQAHVSAALNSSISSGKRYLLAAQAESWQNVLARMVEVEPELEKHLPDVPKEGRLSREEWEEKLFRFEGGEAENDLQFKYDPFDEYVAAFAKQVAELARSGGEL
ncbi:hypothetical protein JCM8097_002985 [Rhodosporidiobolus ruineniae]